MIDLIRRDEALAGILNHYEVNNEIQNKEMDYCFDMLNSLRAVDAVEVVRCRQCCFGVKKRERGEVVTYCGLFWGMKGVLDPNGFCSYGKEINDAKID